MPNLNYRYEDDPLEVDFDINQITIQNFSQKVNWDKTKNRVEDINTFIQDYKNIPKRFIGQKDNYPIIDSEQIKGAIIFMYEGEEGE